MFKHSHVSCRRAIFNGDGAGNRKTTMQRIGAIDTAGLLVLAHDRWT
jgi:hypothetical protein